MKYWDVVYCKAFEPAKKVYFIYEKSQNRVYTKTVGENGFEYFMDHVGTNKWAGRTIRMSCKDGTEPHMILNQKSQSLWYVSLLRPDFVFEIKKVHGDIINDHQVLPNNRVLMMSKDGWLILYRYNPDTSTSIVLDKFKLDIKEEKDEQVTTLSIGPYHSTIAVNTRTESGIYLMRLFVLTIDKGTELYLRDELNLYDGKTKYFCAISFYDKFGDVLVFNAITMSNPTLVYSFSFDGEKVREFKERKSIPGNRSRRLVSVGTKLMSIDDDGNIIKIYYK